MPLRRAQFTGVVLHEHVVDVVGRFEDIDLFLQPRAVLLRTLTGHEPPEAVLQQLPEHGITVAVTLLFLRRHVVTGHVVPFGLVTGFGSLGDFHRVAAHPLEKRVRVPPLAVEERADGGIVFVDVLEVLVVALGMGGTRGDFVEHGFRAGIVSVRIVAVGDEYRLDQKTVVPLVVEGVEEMGGRLQHLGIQTFGLVLRQIHLVEYIVEGFPQGFHRRQVLFHPERREFAEDQYIPFSPAEQFGKRNGRIHSIHHDGFLDAQQVPESALALAVDFHLHFFAFVRQCAGVSDDGTDAGLVAGFLECQRGAHRVPVANAEGGMAHPHGFPHPPRHVTRGVEQFVGSFSAMRKFPNNSTPSSGQKPKGNPYRN